MANKTILYFVRIKPFNPKRGHLLRKFTHAPSGKRFDESHGWYRGIDAGLAQALKEIHVHAHDMDSPFAFDVCTEAEAKAIDASEHKAKERKSAHDATDLTTRDLRTGSREFGSLDANASTGDPVAERREARARRTTRAGAHSSR